MGVLVDADERGGATVAGFAALGRAALTIEVHAGETVISEGDLGDRYHAVVAGRLDVSRGDRHLRSLQRGDGFREVALVADLPRRRPWSPSRTGCCSRSSERRSSPRSRRHDVTPRAAWQIVAAYVPQRSAGDTA